MDGNIRQDNANGRPYFIRNGVKGEYRYYGWDRYNTLYSNVYFINDSKKGTDPNTRNWVFRPWEMSSLIHGRVDKPSRFSPILNGRFDSPERVYNEEKVDEVNSIIQVNGLQVRAAAKNQDTRLQKNLFDYMYVEQDPTAWADGMGRMWHLKDDGAIWYQTFPIDRLEGKQKPGVKAEIIPTNIKSTDLKSLGNEWRWNLDLKGTLQDSKYFNDRYLKALYYTRQDVTEWTLKLEYSYPGQPLTTLKTFSSGTNGNVSFQNQGMIALSNIDVPFKKGSLKKGDKIEFVLTVVSTYKSNGRVFDQDVITYPVVLGETLPPAPVNLPPPLPPPPVEGPPPLVCSPSIPGDAFDIVPFGASDGTDLSRIAKRQVWVDGAEIDADLFFNGGYVFGDDKDGLVTVTMNWTPLPGEAENGADGCSTYRIVLVHDTMPRAQFKLYGNSFKENRKMSVEDTSSDPNANDPLVQAAYPIVGREWSWSAAEGSNDSQRRMGYDGETRKEFLYKKPGEYVLTLTVTNALGRTSEPYELLFSVIPDYEPAVIFYPYSSQIARGEGISLFLDTVSTDGDIITDTVFEVKYDANNDGSYSELIETFTTPLTEYKPPNDKLGRYRISVKVDERFGQETLPAFITAADARSKTVQFEFEVDNYIPYSGIYTDIPIKRQEVDAFFLLDRNLAQSKIDYIKGNGVTINNQLRRYGADPEVNLWDMHTYTFSQAASTVVNTGGYPSQTYRYTSNGYTGTLQLQGASDNGYYQDFGTSQTVVDVPAHTQTVVDVEGHYKTEYRLELWCSGFGDSGAFYDHPGACNMPNSSPYTKTISYQVWVATTYRTITVPTTYKTVWVPNIQWVSNYYGTYSGIIFKDVRQPLVNPFGRSTSNKFVIYVSDDWINDVGDFQRVKALSDARIILVGKNQMKTQVEHDHFILNSGQSIEEIVDEAVTYISSLHPPGSSQIVQVGESFKMLTEESDPEGDPIPLRQTMYIHNEDYFDNAMGHASFAAYAYNEVKWGTETLRTRFDQTGEFRILRRVKDKPSEDPKLASYSYFSNEAETVVFVHRKPVALADLDWTYDSGSGNYLTTWVDRSYDLDHNISDPVNKGIVDRKIKFTFGGETYFKIPASLAPGTYHLEYLVRDVEGAWSDPFIMDFTLASSPPPQLKSKLKAENGQFSITSGIPASEKLTAYDLWTRYPYSLSLSLQMSNGSLINRNVPYFTGAKNGTDILWDDVTGLTIPATTADGTYPFRVRANGSVGGTFAYNDYSVKVFTPIDLKAVNPKPSELWVVGYPAALSATTTKYPSQVTASVFHGTGYARSYSLTAAATEAGQTWSFNIASLPAVPEGNYTIRFIATNPSGKSESVNVPVRVTRNTPPAGSFKTYTYDAANPAMPKYEGDTVYIDPVGLNDNERDPLTVTFKVADSSGAEVLNRQYNWSYPYPESGGPSLEAAKAGSYRVTMIISDGKAAPVVSTGSFTVLPLAVIGTVAHTPEWKEHLEKFNRENPELRRSDNTFWAGERFVLRASVTETGTSPVRATSVSVQLLSRNITTMLNPLVSGKSVNWSGEMWREDFDKLAGGEHRFLFTATYSNGTVKTAIVSIDISGTVWDLMRMHRIK